MIEMPFQKLIIWQKGLMLVDLVYETTATFPRDELYNLTSQMRRSAVSIPSNIAEGSQRTSKKEFGNFILTAKGSLAELHTQTIIGHRRSLIPKEKFAVLIEKITEMDKMLRSFYKQLLK